MAKFRYSMQNVLEIKYKLEEQAKTAFSLAQAKVNAAQERLEILLDQQRYYEDLKRQLLQERLDVRQLNQCEAAIAVMKERVTDQKRTIAALEAVLDNARRKLQKTMVERKTHEKLKENEFASFLQELNAQEKKEIDELVSFQYNKKKE